MSETSAVTCRVCRQQSDASVAVTTPWAPKNPQTIKDIILFCVPRLTIQDNSVLCQTCLWQLRFAHHFIEQCIKTEKVLANLSQKKYKIIPKAPVSTANTGAPKLAKILEKSIEDGNKIKIIFENPANEDKGVVSQNSDHSYVKPPLNQEVTWIKEERPLVPSDNDSPPDESFHEVKVDAVNLENEVQNIEEPNAEEEDTSEKEYPEALVNLFDFAPLEVKFVVAQAELGQEIQRGFVKDGVNILNMATDPNKKKRLIFLGRDYFYDSYECGSCNVRFSNICDSADHRALHKKGKIKITRGLRYECKKCPATFSVERDFRLHCRDAHGIPRPHQCPKCNKNFKTISERKNHENEFKDSDKCELRCSKCSKVFYSATALKKHEDDVADAPCCDYYKCKVCPEKFTRDGFKFHCENVHSNFPCPQCGKDFYSTTSLQVHIKNVHVTDISVCHECGKSIKNKKMLQHHIDTIHGNNKYICDKCPREFKCLVYLRKHMNKIHTTGSQKLSFTCEKCGKSFTTNQQLKQHLEVMHLKVIKYTCPTCGKGFPRKDYMNRHLASHLKGFPCKICKQSFQTQFRLQGHESAGHDENGKSLDKNTKKMTYRCKEFKDKYIKPCVCNICHKVLGSRSNLKLHYKAHLKIREYYCKKCDFNMQQYSSYLKHMKLHEDPNFELSCNICHTYKSSRAELEAHIRETHKILKYQCKYCPAKFGRKHLLFSHESIKHKEQYAKRENLYQALAQQEVVIAKEGSWSSSKKGSKIGPFESDADEVLQKLAVQNTVEEELAVITERLDSDTEVQETFDILSQEYQMCEEEKACIVIQEDMHQSVEDF